MKRLLLFILIIPCITSCRYFLPSERAVARVGTDVLYEGDVLPLIPGGISSEDSANMIHQYIENWAMDHLMEMKANEQLSKEEKDISDEVDAYARSILNFRFEKNYVESRLDTVITEMEVREYYEGHSRSFTYPYALYKVRVITISTRSPYYATVKKNYATTDMDVLAELEDISRSYAEKYETYGGTWVPATTIARDYSINADFCEKTLLASGSYVKEEDEKTVFIFVEDRVSPGELSPIEYNEKGIQDAILSKRKQDVLKQLGNSLLEEAYQNKKLKIYGIDE